MQNYKLKPKKKGKIKKVNILNSINLGEDICIDPGSDFTSIYIVGRGMVLREASVVACHKVSGEVVAVGDEAAEMEERAPRTLEIIHPIQKGVIIDEVLAGELFLQLISKVKKSSVIKPRMMLSLPAGITDVEERAYITSLMRGGARQVIIVDAPVAAALGAGCDVTLARGLMVLDIGGGKTSIAAVSLCNTVTSKKIYTAGDSFTNAVKAFILKKYNLEISTKTARKIKENLGSVTGELSGMEEVFGIDATNRLPRRIRVSAYETSNIFDYEIEDIITLIKDMLDTVPPEILGDIMADGILLVGGGAKLNGIAYRLREKSGIKIFPADHIDICNIRGTGLALENLNSLPNIAQSYHNL